MTPTPVTESSAALACLRRHPLFHVLAEAELAPLAAAARSRRIAAGQDIFAEDGDAQTFYAIVAGEVELYRASPQGDEKVFQILGAGDLLAEAAMFLEPARYPMNARAFHDTKLLAFPRRALVALCDASPRLLRTLLSALAKRLHEALNRIEHLSINNAGQRLVTYLLDLSRHQSGRWIDLPVGIAVLAGQLAMTPETLSRLLQKYRRDGLISGRGRTFVLLNVRGLCDRVGLPQPDHSAAPSAPPMVGCCSLR